jgi:hypothetical protein
MCVIVLYCQVGGDLNAKVPERVQGLSAVSLVSSAGLAKANRENITNNLLLRLL